MFNRDEWSKILKDAYGIRSEKICGVWLFETRGGMEMNFVGDYIEMPNADFFEKANAIIRVDSKPKYWNFESGLETYRLKCDKSFERILKEDIHQKSRNLIYKAEKNGVVTEIANDEESLWEYYKMYVRSMCGIGAIPQSFELFSAARKEFGKDFILFLSKLNGKDVSGIVALRNGNRLHIWSNGQSKEARLSSANMKTYADVIKFACENGLEVDFGNSEESSSLAFFKSRFGTKKIPVWTVQKGQIRHGKRSRLPAKLMAFLPVSVLSMASRILFKYIR